MITDKGLKGNGICLKNRPDIQIHLNKHSIIIEIDEEQHKWYNPICDEARINNIQEALNRTIKTAFKTIPKNQEQNQNNILVKLKDTLALSLDNYTDDPIRIIKLFYDNV